MNITKLENGTLLVPCRAEGTTENGENIVGDGIIEVAQDSPEYQKYLEMYNHDLFIILEQRKLIEEDKKQGRR